MTLRLTNLPYDTDTGLGHRARLGLVVLATDYTVEHEYRTILADLDGVALYGARIPMAPVVTPESLGAMEADIPRTVSLILPDDRLDVVAYGCSSATAILGEDRVTELVRRIKPEAAVTTPITAAKAALRTLGARKIGILTPYTADVNVTLQAAFEEAGFEIEIFGSFDEPRDQVVASITESAIRTNVNVMAEAAQIDAMFISCTSLRSLKVVVELERDLGIPVTASNHAMIWHSLRLAGIGDQINGKGLLF
ncbi:MAG: Asp/Glu racemase, partial [Pseudomonadota bacterium]